MEKDLQIRKEAYERNKCKLEENCKICIMRSFERCDDCTIGRKLRYLEIEYSDVTGWSHDYWWGKKR